MEKTVQNKIGNGFLSEIKDTSVLGKIAFIADIFTIIGISFAALFAKPIAETFLNKEIRATDFFFFGSILIFWILVFFSLLVAFTYLKSMFQKFKFGLFFYYGLIIVYWFIGFSLLTSLGFEVITHMFNL